MPYPPKRVARDNQSSRGTRRVGARTRLLGYHLSGVAVIVALLGAPATTAVANPSAVDQYTQHLPTANGGSAAGGGAAAAAPVARPGLLPARTLAALSGPEGKLLAQIATARDLGAPAKAGSAKRLGASNRGFVTVAAESMGGAPSLILIGALVAIIAGGAVIHRRRSSADRL
jgi:energy-converting hydrogenase Eha subunit B